MGANWQIFKITLQRSCSYIFQFTIFICRTAFFPIVNGKDFICKSETLNTTIIFFAITASINITLIIMTGTWLIAKVVIVRTNWILTQW